MPLRQSNSGAPAFVNGVGSLAFSSAVQPGTLLAIGFRTASGSTLHSVSDSVNGAWTLLATQANGGGGDYVGYFLNTAAGTPTVTVTLDNGLSARINIVEFTGVLATGFDQGPLGATGTGTTLTAATSTTTAQPTELVLGFFSAAADITFSQNGAWVIAGTPTTRTAFVYQEVSAIGTYAPAVTISTSQAWIAQAMLFIQQDAPELRGNPYGLRGQSQMQQLLAT